MVAGIPVSVHWTFLLLLLWVAINTWRNGGGISGVVVSLAFVIVIFACVTLHELGHALAARRYGIITRDITLLPIGGLARLDRIPEDPKQELVVALAGPAVNVVIGSVLYLLAILTSDENILANFATEGLKASTFLTAVAYTNLFLALFNLLPAFPMDGGRVFRALLSFAMSRVKATNIAANVGKLVSIGFAAYGLLVGQPFLLLIALFVFFGAGMEAKHVEDNAVLSGLRVADALRTRFAALSTDVTLGEAVSELLRGGDTDFIVMDNGKVEGILTRTHIVEAMSKGAQAETAAGLVMQVSFISVSTNTGLSEARQKLAESGQNILPVIDNGELRGIIDAENILEMIMLRSAAAAAPHESSWQPART